MTPRAETCSWRWHIAAFVAYALVAALFIDHGKSLTHDIAGQGPDPFLFTWFLAWWPWAIVHHQNLLFSNLLWQPLGVYLGWVTSVPLLGIAGWPLTLISSVLTFNFFVLLGPVLAAFMAYLLCLRIVRQPLPAMIGGFLFGFSSYEMGQDITTLNLSFTLFVPALLLIVLCRLDGTLSRAGTILLGALVLICQFLVSIEIFATMFVFGGIAWALAMPYLPERRVALLRLAADGLLAVPLALVVLSPFLISMAWHPDYLKIPAIWPYYFSIDLLNFFIPVGSNLFGGWFTVISRHFNAGINEQDGYIGLPLLILIVLFAREQSARPAARLLIVMFLLLALFSLGPRLWIAGHCSLVLPWMLFTHVPLLASALPARFMLFVSLCTAMMAAMWMSGGQRSRRLVLGGLACLVLLPGWHPWMPVPASRFFQPGRVEAVLGRQARVLVLPFADNGPSSFWQAENRFGFVQTGGYLGIPPKPMQIYPAVIELFGGTEKADFLADFVNFCAATHTQFIVAGPGTSSKLQTDLARLHWPAQKIDDVVVYAVPGGAKIAHG